MSIVSYSKTFYISSIISSINFSATSSYPLTNLIGLNPESGSSYARGALNRAGNTAEIWCAINCSEIPEDAIITSVTGRIHANVSSNSSDTSRTMQFYYGATAKGTAANMPTSYNNKASIDPGEWTREELNDVRVKYSYGNSNRTSNTIYLRGARLTVNYDVEVDDSSPFYIKNNGLWQPYAKVYKKIDGAWVEQEFNSLGLTSESKLIKLSSSTSTTNDNEESI